MVQKQNLMAKMDKQVKLARLEQTIRDFYEAANISERLIEAIFYSVDAGGKRLRPLLLLDTLEALGLTLTTSHFQVAASVELIHTGSLIHDDLPAMDNDDYRRGRLTNHKKFDEATAILAGDSLFLDPFGLVAQTTLPADVKVAIILELSQAAGTFGMVAGQMLDMMSEGQAISLAQLQTIHANKTGALLTFPFVAAGLIAEVSAPVLSRLRKIGSLVGLAFQVRDDILDVTADFDVLGKTPKKDVTAEKSTYPALLGLAPAQKFLNEVLDEAIEELKKLAQSQKVEMQQLIEMIESLR